MTAGLSASSQSDVNMTAALRASS
uniref:Uncharacterized protein n=1 Tax=Anguilla anguilla TaxID=7936 RepID=A0A0E9PGF4_ANGAN